MRSSLDYAGFAQLCGRSPIMREIMCAHNRIIPRSLPLTFIVALTTLSRYCASVDVAAVMATSPAVATCCYHRCASTNDMVFVCCLLISACVSIISFSFHSTIVDVCLLSCYQA